MWFMGSISSLIFKMRFLHNLSSELPRLWYCAVVTIRFPANCHSDREFAASADLHPAVPSEFHTHAGELDDPGNKGFPPLEPQFGKKLNLHCFRAEQLSRPKR